MEINRFCIQFNGCSILSYIHIYIRICPWAEHSPPRRIASGDSSELYRKKDKNLLLLCEKSYSLAAKTHWYSSSAGITLRIFILSVTPWRSSIVTFPFVCTCRTVYGPSIWRPMKDLSSFYRRSVQLHSHMIAFLCSVVVTIRLLFVFLLEAIVCHFALNSYFRLLISMVHRPIKSIATSSQGACRRLVHWVVHIHVLLFCIFLFFTCVFIHKTS